MKFDMILCTGDLTSEKVLDFLSKLSKKLYIVMGNMDHIINPDKHIIEIGNLKVGLIHGDVVWPRGNIEQLTKLALSMNVDVLISGHTHSPFIHEIKVDGKKILLLNPGSATGVWSGGLTSGNPSFMIVDFSESYIEVRLYELLEGKLKEGANYG